MPTILPSPSPTIAVLSQKGGTGKTTMVRTLTDVLRRVGLDVLPVDLDPQGNLSDYFDVDPEATPTIGEVLAGRARAVDAIHKNMIPANLGLAEAELVLAGKMGRELTLKRALSESRRQHDVIIIDCPSGARSADGQRAGRGDALAGQHRGRVLLAPGSRAGARGDGARARQPEREPRTGSGVVMNIADLRTIHSREALVTLRQNFGEKVFQTVIRKSIRYPESAERGVSILDYRPELGTDYIALADEVLTRLGDEETRERLSALRTELYAQVG